MKIIYNYLQNFTQLFSLTQGEPHFNRTDKAEEIVGANMRAGRRSLRRGVSRSSLISYYQMALREAGISNSDEQSQCTFQ